MKIRFFLATLLAIVFVSCGGTSVTPAQKKSAASSVSKTFTALNALNLGATNSKVTPQANGTFTADCSGGGSISYTFSSTNSTFTFGISTPAVGCTVGSTKLVATNFSYTLASSNNGNTLSLTYNGNLSVTSNGTTSVVSFSNLSFTVNIGGTQQNPTFSFTLNGSMTADGVSVTFNNDTYTAAEFN